MIRLAGITRVYGSGESAVQALHAINLTIEKGEYVSIMGPSGSGKSTLLNILGCLDRPTAGSYLFENRETSSLSEKELSLLRRHRIGFVFQTFHLVPRLTCAGNVELPMIFAGVEGSERRERIGRALDAMGLTSRAKHRPGELSGGERQRVAIARAMVMTPAVLLADEPTGNLDHARGREILEILERMNASGLTLIMVTHDAALGARARRTVEISDGEIIRDVRNAHPSSA